MALLTPDTPLSTALEQHSTLIPLVSRFGIRLGLGDKSVATVCAEYGIDAGFMLTLMNTYLFEEYFPEQKLKSFHVSQIVDYLTKTNAYYLHSQLPNIERHLGSLIASGEGENKNLALIGRFFARFERVVPVLPGFEFGGCGAGRARACPAGSRHGRRGPCGESVARPAQHHGTPSVRTI